MVSVFLYDLEMPILYCMYKNKKKLLPSILKPKTSPRRESNPGPHISLPTHFLKLYQ